MACSGLLAAVNQLQSPGRQDVRLCCLRSLFKHLRLLITMKSNRQIPATEHDNVQHKTSGQTEMQQPKPLAGGAPESWSKRVLHKGTFSISKDDVRLCLAAAVRQTGSTA